MFGVCVCVCLFCGWMMCLDGLELVWFWSVLELNYLCSCEVF